MPVRRSTLFWFLMSSSILALPCVAGAQTRLLRFPDIAGERIVFTYAGDLWLAPAGGGGATRLTSHPGLELFARFSPDGESIAFTGQYDGDEQVYVIPASGGIPRELTFYPALGPLPPRWGYDNLVYGWTPDGRSVLFRSYRDGWDLGDGQLFTVPVEGGLPVALPMPSSGAGDLSPDGSRVVYSPLFRDFRHWKRYAGGWAQDLYIFDLESHDARRITDHPRSDRDPMWIGEKIYFTSDRDGTLNLFVYDLASQATEQLTRSQVWDVRWPSADPETGRIVYELNGGLHVFHTESGRSEALSIHVPTDGLAMRPGRISVADAVENIALSPKGERALFAARGDLFTVPVEHGPTRNLTRSSGAHDRAPDWSPDGSRIAFVSDRSGEEEIYTVDQAGHGEPRQLTRNSRARYSELLWSPDSTRIAYRDQGSRLYVVAVETGDVVEVADDPAVFGLDYQWSPDSRYLTFSLGGENGLRSVYIWSLEEDVTRRVTDELFNDFSPSFGPDGQYLYYLSDREFAPQIGSIEFNYVLDRETYIYALALREDTAHPFPPRSDEVSLQEEAEEDDEEGQADGKKQDKKQDKKEAKKKDTGADGEKGEDSVEPLRIDFDGLARRVARVPLAADNYVALAAIPKHLLYVRTGAGYYGRASDRKPELRIFSLEEREDSALASGIQGVALSADGSKVLVGKGGGTYELVDAKPKGGDSAKKLSTAGLEMDRVPRQEWAQIFDEVWRRFRDFFYVENMHGYDWEGLRERYRPLLDHVAHRSDLNYVLSEMIAELNSSHTYVTGGDYEVPERPQTALLGARFRLDEASGRYRVAKVFEGQNEEDTYRSPLTEIGVGVAVDDYLLAINGEELVASDNPYRLLRHAGSGPVELTVNGEPSLSGARRVTVRPLARENSLIYLEWILHNRRRVDEATGGRVGYIHLPDMGASGIREWIKWFYGQIRKQGLIIDVRSNGGGNVSQMIIERLRRELLMLDFERNLDHPDTYPNRVFHGHLVCLLDEDTASDGDQFAYVFREAGLGPLIGKRSWGGVIGIYGRGPLIDGGGVNVPEVGSANVRGEWVVEGHGVEPDIEVANSPRDILAGRDPQLEKAIEVVLQKIGESPRDLPQAPPPPVKTKTVGTSK